MIKPLKDKVAIRVEEVKPVSEGGIILPSSVTASKNQGTVVAVGKDVVEVKAGDYVVFDSSRAWKIDQSGEELSVMPEELVLAVL